MPKDKNMQKKESARREERQAPNTARAFRRAGGDTNVSVRDRSARRRSGALPPPVHDDGWQTSHECGVEGDALEPDCSNPGTYYCLGCWQQWERGDIEDEGDEEDESETVAAVNYKNYSVSPPPHLHHKFTPSRCA